MKTYTPNHPFTLAKVRLSCEINTFYTIFFKYSQVNSPLYLRNQTPFNNLTTLVKEKRKPKDSVMNSHIISRRKMFHIELAIVTPSKQNKSITFLHKLLNVKYINNAVVLTKNFIELVSFVLYFCIGKIGTFE
jgi:hypothetical protein